MTSDKPAYKAPVVPIGWSVQWLPHADPNEAAWTAIVLMPTTTAGLRLLVISPTGAFDRKSGVRNIDDPQLQNMDRTARAARGAWQWIPGHVAPQPGGPSRSQLEQRIADLHLHGGAEGRPMSSVMIAQQLNEEAKAAGEPENWTHQKVTPVLRKLGLT